jgi:hypothetical protein
MIVTYVSPFLLVFHVDQRVLQHHILYKTNSLYIYLVRP